MTEERPSEFRYRNRRGFWIAYGLLWLVIGVISLSQGNWLMLVATIFGLGQMAVQLRRVRQLSTN